MAVLNRRDYYAAIPQLEGRLSKLSKYITVEEGKLQIKIDDLYGNVATLTQTAESIESRVEGIEDDYVTSTVLTQMKNALTLEINEKAQVFTSQPTTPYYVGDLWTQGPNGEIYRCKTNRLSGNYTATDWEKASDYTDDTTATAEVTNRTMLIRSFNGGTITAYKGNDVGVYTNASGSVDIVELSWNGNTPSVDDTYASYGSEATVGSTSTGSANMHIWSNSTMQSSEYEFRYGSATKGSIRCYSTGAVNFSAYWSINLYGGGTSGLSISASSVSVGAGDTPLYLSGSRVSSDSINVSGYVSASGSLSGSSLNISGKATVDKLYVSTPGTASSSAANCRIATGESNRIMFTGSGSTIKIKHAVQPIEEDELNPHRLYDADVIQFIYNEDFLNKKDCRYNKPLAGFIAEDLLQVYPTAVDVEDGEAKDWNYKYIIPPMLALIQEQNERIKALERRLA